MSISLFDVNTYCAANPDLAAAGLTTDAQLLSHFQNFGLKEGRNFSALVNLNFYRASNQDLAADGLTSSGLLPTGDNYYIRYIRVLPIANQANYSLSLSTTQANAVNLYNDTSGKTPNQQSPNYLAFGTTDSSIQTVSNGGTKLVTGNGLTGYSNHL